MTGNAIAGTAIVVGLFCGAFAILFAWKNHKEHTKAHKSAAVFAGLAGMLLSGSIVGYFGGFGGFKVAGASITGFAGFFCAVWAIMEARGYGHHAIRTPVIAAAAMVFLGASTGAVGNIIHHANSGTANVARKVSGPAGSGG